MSGKVSILLGVVSPKNTVGTLDLVCHTRIYSYLPLDTNLEFQIESALHQPTPRVCIGSLWNTKNQLSKQRERERERG